MEDEAEDFVPNPVAADAGAHSFDDAGEVATERDGKLVLGHRLQRSCRNEDVDRVDRGGTYAHEQLVFGDVGLWDVGSDAGLGRSCRV